MENKSFLNKFVILLILITVISIIIVFVMNKNTVAEDLKEVEVITSLNVDTYDEDLYVYKIENNILYTSEYFYNNYYLSNNTVSFNEYKIAEDTKLYLKTLSNTDKDINDIKISYDPIDMNQFTYLLKNYTLLKVYIWKNTEDSCKNVLLYSSNNISLEMEHY